MSSNKGLKRLAYFLFLGSATFSIWFGWYKLEAFAYHSRDFPYYIQFAARLADPALTDHVTVSPIGVNFLGFYGSEATRSIHQAIHFEPVKYLFALLYHLFETPLVLFALIAAVYFAPLLYVAHRFPQREAVDRWLMGAFMLAYCLFPAVPFAVTYDIRPYILLAPIFTLVVLAVSFGRPRREVLTLFHLLFLAREEALLLGLAVILYTAALHRQEGRRGWYTVRPLIGSWLLWATVIAIYYLWTGYPNGGSAVTVAPLDADSDGFNEWALVPLIAVACLGGWYLFLWLRRRAQFMTYLPAITFSLIFLPLAWQYYASFRGRATDDLLHHLFYGSRMSLYLSTVLLWLVVMGRLVGPPSRRLVAGGLLLATALLFPLNFRSDQSVAAKLQAYARARQQTALVRSFEARAEFLPDTVLTDQHTFQAFYDHDEAFDYRRLPWYLAPKDFPHNIPVLRDLIAEDVEWIVVHEESQDEVDVLNQQALGAWRTELIAQNGEYLIFQVDHAP